MDESLALQERLMARLVGHPTTTPQAAVDAPKTGLGTETDRGLALLRLLSQLDDPVVEPELDAHARLGHRFPTIETAFGLTSGAGLELLEYLAELDLLGRELHNQVHTCPRCGHCQLNFREMCPACRSIDVRITRLILHFRCSYTAPEKLFESGMHLRCPKCQRRLNQLGQDFERPGDTYSCNSCHELFEEPTLNAQCFNCSHRFATTEVETERIYTYRPTALAERALAQGRLTSLDVQSVMFDFDRKFATWDYLALEIEREVERLVRYNSPFSAARVAFELEGRPYPLFREWSADAIRNLAGVLAATTRSLDLVAKIDGCTFGVFWPETDTDGCSIAERRLHSRLNEVVATSSSGLPLEIHWQTATWTSTHTTSTEVTHFLVHGSRADGAAEARG